MLLPTLICFDATKFVLLSVFTLIETIYPRICSKSRPRSEKKSTSALRLSLKNVVAKAHYHDISILTELRIFAANFADKQKDYGENLPLQHARELLSFSFILGEDYRTLLAVKTWYTNNDLIISLIWDQCTLYTIARLTKTIHAWKVILQRIAIQNFNTLFCCKGLKNLYTWKHSYNVASVQLSVTGGMTLWSSQWYPHQS